MHDEQFRAAFGQRLRGFERARFVADAETHLGRERHPPCNGATNLRGYPVEQHRLVQQHRAAAVAINLRRGATKIQIDARRGECNEPRRIVSQTPWVRTEQLHAHRRAGGGA